MSRKLENRYIAKRYAKALHSLAGGKAADLVQDAKALAEACAQAELKAFFHNPLLTRAQSAEVAGAVLDKVGAPELLKDVAVSMAHNRRLPALAEMLEQFVLLVEGEQNIVRVKIVSAKKLGDAEIKQLSDKIAKTYDCKLSVETEINPALIGGVQLTMGDKQIDYSVAGKLDRLADTLKNTPLSNKG